MCWWGCGTDEFFPLSRLKKNIKRDDAGGLTQLASSGQAQSSSHGRICFVVVVEAEEDEKQWGLILSALRMCKVGPDCEGERARLRGFQPSNPATNTMASQRIREAWS